MGDENSKSLSRSQLLLFLVGPTRPLGGRFAFFLGGASPPPCIAAGRRTGRAPVLNVSVRLCHRLCAANIFAPHRIPWAQEKYTELPLRTYVGT